MVQSWSMTLELRAKLIECEEIIIYSFSWISSLRSIRRASPFYLFHRPPLILSSLSHHILTASTKPFLSRLAFTPGYRYECHLIFCSENMIWYLKAGFDLRASADLRIMKKVVPLTEAILARCY